MRYQLVLIAIAAFTAETRGRLPGQPNYVYDNDMGGSVGGGDLVDDEDFEGSGGHDEVSGRVTCGS